VARLRDDAAEARTTPVGLVPTPAALPVEDLSVSREDLEAVLAVDPAEWAEEIDPIREFFGTFGEKLPAELTRQLDLLAERVAAARR
jgi:phosphoenolpyruvate carboxykinase (GTP)